MDVVRKLEQVKTGERDHPLVDCVIEDSGIIEVTSPFDVAASDATAWLTLTLAKLSMQL